MTNSLQLQWHHQFQFAGYYAAVGQREGKAPVCPAVPQPYTGELQFVSPQTGQRVRGVVMTEKVAEELWPLVEEHLAGDPRRAPAESAGSARPATARPRLAGVVVVHRAHRGVDARITSAGRCTVNSRAGYASARQPAV